MGEKRGRLEPPSNEAKPRSEQQEDICLASQSLSDIRKLERSSGHTKDKNKQAQENSQQRREDSHEKLHKLAAKKLGDDSALKTFEKNLGLIEMRFKGKEGGDLEVAKTFEQITRLFEATGDKPSDEKQRCLLARQVAFNAAKNSDQISALNAIKQGNHKTCNVTDVELRTYCLYPSDAARVVVDAALTNKYKPPASGFVVELDADSLKPDYEASQIPTPAGWRNYASQIFQITAVQTFWQDAGCRPGGKLLASGESIRYKQIKPNDNSSDDTGERLVLVGRAGKEKETIAEGPRIDHNDIAKISRLITGRNEIVAVAALGTAFSHDDGAQRVNDEKGLHQFLSQAVKGDKYFLQQPGDEEMKEMSYKLPVIVYIPGKGQDSHVIVAARYDPEKREVSIQNTYAPAKDRTGAPGAGSKMPVDELWRLMSP